MTLIKTSVCVSGTGSIDDVDGKKLCVHVQPMPLQMHLHLESGMGNGQGGTNTVEESSGSYDTG